MSHAIPYACILAALILIYIPRMVVAAVLVRSEAGLDNALPRAQQATLTGFGARAHAAHLNSIEAFPPFAAGVLACELRQVAVERTALLAITFVALRALYIALYLGNVPAARTGVWVLGLLTTLALLTLACAA